MFIYLHSHYYAVQESTENECPGSSKIQMSMKLTCVKWGCILLYHCILNAKQLVKNYKGNISENTDGSSFSDFYKYMFSGHLFIFQRLHCCLIFFSWIVRSIESSYNGIIGLLSPFCLMCMLLNQESADCLYFARVPSCVCASATISCYILYVDDGVF